MSHAVKCVVTAVQAKTLKRPGAVSIDSPDAVPMQARYAAPLRVPPMKHGTPAVRVLIHNGIGQRSQKSNKKVPRMHQKVPSIGCLKEQDGQWSRKVPHLRQVCGVQREPPLPVLRISNKDTRPRSHSKDRQVTQARKAENGEKIMWPRVAESISCQVHLTVLPMAAMMLSNHKRAGLKKKRRGITACGSCECTSPVRCSPNENTINTIKALAIIHCG